MHYFKKIIILFTILLFSFTLFANTSDQQIALIFDASGSMWGQIDGVSKIKIARKAMTDLIKDLEKQKNIQLSLRIYGHLNKQCDNSILEIPMGSENHSAIIEKINSIKPNGRTPIAFSLLESINDFNPNLTDQKVIILITDGKESCNGNTCEAAQKIKDAGIVATIHVVGFGMKKNELASLNCIVDPFGGKVIGAANTKELIGAFKKITREVSIPKNLKVIGLDKNDKPVYMYVDIIKNNKQIKSSEGISPTFTLDNGVYDIHAKSSSSGIKVEKKNIKIEQDKKRIIKIIFGESILKLKTLDSNNKLAYATYTIYQGGTEEQIGIAEGRDFQQTVIPPGIYDIKIYEHDTGLMQWTRNIELKPGETLEKIFKFELGTLKFKTVDSNDKALYTTYTIYKSGTEQQIGIAEGRDFQQTVISPGIYDIKIYEYDTRLIQWTRNVELKSGETLEKIFKFELGTLRFKTIDSSNNFLYSTYTIYKSGTEQQIGIGEGRDFQKIVVPSGIYDIKIYEYDSDSTKWERNITIKAGEMYEKIFKF